MKITGFQRGLAFYAIPFLSAEAKRLNLDGWVRNNYNDKTVETIAEGDEKKLKMLLEALKKGSPFSGVDNVTEKWDEPGGVLRGFEIK